ncbi:MAG TPA: cupin domain-containing protein [Candidatus Acidoferrales bacterium]|nr:cupin domain-containing protein [Candidatus Acidoferrales bacterium]
MAERPNSARGDFPNLTVVRASEVRSSAPEPGLTRKVLAYNDKLFLVEHHLAKGWAGAVHSHPHEQVVYVVSGRLNVNCEGRTVEVSAGDSFLVRGGVPHGATALEDSVVVDIFTPWREDYL